MGGEGSDLDLIVYMEVSGRAAASVERWDSRKPDKTDRKARRPIGQHRSTCNAYRGSKRPHVRPGGARLPDMDGDDGQRDGIDRRLAEFAAAVRGSPHNLLSERALGELESRHIAESRAFAATLPKHVSVLDVGTGGGFPGMVIAITRPDLEVTLLDATRKKIEFLRDFVTSTGLDVRTLHGRAESLQREHAASFDIVTARAVAPLERLVDWAVPFLRPGGQLHAIKGDRWPAELKAALPAIQRLGARVVDVPGHGDGPTEASMSRSSANQDSLATAAPRVVIIQAAG